MSGPTTHGVHLDAESNLVGIEVWENVAGKAKLSRLAIRALRSEEVILEE